MNWRSFKPTCFERDLLTECLNGERTWQLSGIIPFIASGPSFLCWRGTTEFQSLLTNEPPWLKKKIDHNSWAWWIQFFLVARFSKFSIFQNTCNHVYNMQFLDASKMFWLPDKILRSFKMQLRKQNLFARLAILHVLGYQTMGYIEPCSDWQTDWWTDQCLD